MKIVPLTFLSAAVALLGATAVAQTDSYGTGEARTYVLAALSASGESGTVTLKPQSAGSTLVTIALKGAPADAQPAHIHVGPCAKLNPSPKYALKNVVNGESSTVVDAPMAELTGGTLAVNVHKSTSDLATYVACGDLASSSALPSASQSSGTMNGGMGTSATGTTANPAGATGTPATAASPHG
jgi:hypothetical protein